MFNLIGDRNPQLLRELRSRFQPRGIFIALFLSLLAQVLVLWFFQMSLDSNPQGFCVLGTPIPENGGGLQDCLVDAQNRTKIDYSRWWLAILISLNWGIPAVLVGLGMYLLIGDLQQEEERGTLNFLRLSPRSSFTVLWGKLLGVPSLLYVAIAAIVPLHILAVIQAKIPPFFLISYYGLLILDSLFLFCISLLSGFAAARTMKGGGRSLLNNSVNITLPALIVFFILPSWGFFRFLGVWAPYSKALFGSDLRDSVERVKILWYGLPIGVNFLWAHAIYILISLVGIFWIWQVLRRCYTHPTATLLGKVQSYGIVISAQALLLGFILPLAKGSSERMGALGVVLALMLPLLLVLSAAILPHRQGLLDWSRSRQDQEGKKRPLLLDLLVHEQSPAILAILVNIGLALLFCIPWFLPGTIPKGLSNRELGNLMETRTAMFWGVALSLSALVLYVTIAQLALSMKTNKRANWAVGLVALTMLLPLICGSILSIGSAGSPLQRIFLLASPFPWFGLFSFRYDESGALTDMGIAVAVLGFQWLMTLLLSVQLGRRLKAAV
jgi:hypothetical protein